MPNLDIAELNRIYQEAEEADREIFAEQRSNILLVAGDHYSKISNRLWNNTRNPSRSNMGDSKLRLTKNHMHRIQRAYKTSILSEAPGVTVLPKRDTDLQDKKDADLNLAVWQDVKDRHKIKKKVLDWVSWYTTIGEVCLKVFWDNDAGEFQGYEQALDEDGQPKFTDRVDEETGEVVQEMVPDKDLPVFSGDFVFEPVFGFNLLVESGTEDMDDVDSAWIVRKMVDTKILKRKYKDDEEKLAGIVEASKQTYVVFDVQKGSYAKKKGETLVKEFYWKPSPSYPMGYYVHATDTVILEEGELPFGIFPLVWAGFDKHPTSPRGRSILKVARPYQAEINRASSSMATAQVTMGDDKLIYSAGSKLAPGALLPGVRGISVSGGQAPTVLPGRSGAQYLEYVMAQIAEMNDVLSLDQTQVIDKSGQVDPYAMLFRSATQKRLYSPYIEAFEEFLKDVCGVVLTLARVYLPEDMLITAVGKREIINIAEFRDTTPLSYHIKLEAGSDTVESLIGRQVTYQHLLQYVGKQLDPKTIGKMIKNMPYGNSADTVDDLMVDDENATNDMLAVERGEQVVATEHSDPGYMLKRLNHRMKKSDYRFLPPQVQQGYMSLVAQYEQIVEKLAAAEMAAKNEFIPAEGALVTCDFYVEDPANPENQAKRAKIPQRALEWLLKRLEEQGMTMEKLEGMNAKSLQELARAMQQAPGAQSPQQPMQGGPVDGQQIPPQM